MFAGARGDPTASDGLVGVDGPGADAAERRDGPALVPGGLESRIRRRQRELVDAQQGPQLGPGNLPVAGDQCEQETAVLVLDPEGLHEIRGPDPEDTGRLL